MLIDALSAAAIFCAASIGETSADSAVGLLLLYHVLAFGLPVIFGLAVDATRMPRHAAVGGCLITASALLSISWPIATVFLAGIGNALFHVGGAVRSLQATPHRATGPGLFVAPGSIGLLFGTILGKTGYAASLCLLPIALGLALAMLAIDNASSAEAETGNRRQSVQHAVAQHRPLSRFERIIGLVLVSIAVRSLLGFLAVFPWETAAGWLIAATLATTLGKALGGILADRWGWRPLAAGATAASLPLLAWGAAHPAVLIAGLLLLNLAMPVTLTGVAEAIPRHEGFAFGLTCVALLVGSLPALLGYPPGSVALVAAMIVISSLALDRGFRILSLDCALRERE